MIKKELLEYLWFSFCSIMILFLIYTESWPTIIRLEKTINNFDKIYHWTAGVILMVGFPTRWRKTFKRAFWIMFAINILWESFEVNEWYHHTADFVLNKFFGIRFIFDQESFTWDWLIDTIGDSIVTVAAAVWIYLLRNFNCKNLS